MIYTFGAYRLDTNRFELWRDKEPVPVEPQVFGVLCCLIENRDRVVGKEDLIDRVWDGRFIADATLSARLSAARRAVGDNGKDQTIIRTVAKRGFRFVAEVIIGTADEVELAATVSPSEGSGGPLSLSAGPSLAVLPFTNMSGDREQDYFADGLTEDIITALGRCRWLRVTARNSTFVYKGRAVDVRRVAEDLGVKYVLEGSVRLSGERVRVTAQLVNGADGQRIWGNRFDRDLKDVFTVQDEITTVIAGTVEPELEMIDAPMLRDSSIANLDAWDCYQRGLWHLYRFTTDELDAAKSLFERAIALDEEFAQAYARLAYVHIQLGWYGPHEERPARLKDAIVLSRRAIELDDRDSAARFALGRALAQSGKAERGIEELRTAVALEPSYAQGHFALAQALCYVERPDEGLPEIEEALRLSPQDPHLWTFLNVRALLHYQAGALQQAEADERAAMRLPNATHWPAFVLLAVLGRQGKTEAAQEVIAELHRYHPSFTCDDARREFYFVDRPYITRRFIERFVDDIRSAGLPE